MKSRKVSKTQHRHLEFFHCSEFWLGSWQYGCREACQSAKSVTQSQHRTNGLSWVPKKPYFNTLRLRQNGRHFANDIFSCIFLNENISIVIWLGTGQAPIHCLTQWWLIYWCTYTPLGINGLKAARAAKQSSKAYQGQSKKIFVRFSNPVIALLCCPPYEV